jgi:hypothetical protein
MVEVAIVITTTAHKIELALDGLALRHGKEFMITMGKIACIAVRALAGLLKLIAQCGLA